MVGENDMSDERNIHPVVIVGSGPAGLTAAIYAARAGLAPVVVEGLQSGGQLMQTSDVENYPGFAAPVSGPVLMDAMRRQAEACGAAFLTDTVQAVDLTGAVKKLETFMNGTLAARAVILCTGAAPRWLEAEGEKTYRGRGVSACATCDGAFFKGRDVAVIGGGESALEEALYLSRICSSVTVVHRRASFRASQVMVRRVAETANIRVVWQSVVRAFEGDGTRLTGVRIADVETGAERTCPVAGAFVAVGHVPETGFLAGQVALDEAGYIRVDARRRTDRPGVFAAGDCADAFDKQAIVAAGAGATAALEAERYLLEAARMETEKHGQA